MPVCPISCLQSSWVMLPSSLRLLFLVLSVSFCPSSNTCTWSHGLFWLLGYSPHSINTLFLLINLSSIALCNNSACFKIIYTSFSPWFLSHNHQSHIVWGEACDLLEDRFHLVISFSVHMSNNTIIGSPSYVQQSYWCKTMTVKLFYILIVNCLFQLAFWCTMNNCFII